jgi:hypothetical protein
MKPLIFLVTILTLQSCATLFSPAKRHSHVPINSNVKNYEVYVNGNYMGDDISVIEVDPHDMVQVKKEGYSSQTTIIQSAFNAVSLFNLLDPTFITGWIVDLATGNTRKVKTKAINVKLKKEE